MNKPVSFAHSIPASGDAALQDQAPYYLPSADEITLFEQCHRNRLAVMLTGPTGCGKTRFVEHMAWRLGRPLITVSCHDDLSASDLIGRFLIRPAKPVWHDGHNGTAPCREKVCEYV